MASSIPTKTIQLKKGGGGEKGKIHYAELLRTNTEK